MTTTTTITSKCQGSADNLLSDSERQPPSFPLLHLLRLLSLTPRTHTERQSIHIYKQDDTGRRWITPSQSSRSCRRGGATTTMGQQEELAAVLKPPAGMVFSWEPVAVISTKPAAVEARGDTIVMPPGSPTKKAAAAPPARRLSVPPPPGRTATRSLSSRGASGRAVRPEDDPFLAAYLACTKSTKGGRDAGGTPGEANKQGRSRFTWARLGLSCKSSAGVVERSMVKVAKRPELDPRDA